MFDAWLHLDEIYQSDNDLSKPPTFDLRRHFHKKEITSFGLKKSVTFYAEYDPETEIYSIPVCAISWQVIFDGNNPKTQIKRTAWIINGKFQPIHEIKLKIEKPKVFLQTMRARIIEELIDLAVNFGFEEKIKALYEKYSSLVYIYKEGGSPKFRDAIASSKESWLDEVIPATGNKPRDVLVQYLSIGVV